MNNYKRLFKFLKGRYAFFIISIIMVVIIQLLTFVTPLIVKVVLDDCILGIDCTWDEVEDASENTVYYNNHYYIQDSKLTSEEVLSKNTITIQSKGIFFINSEIEDGTNSIVDLGDNNYQLSVTTADDIYTYFANKLSITEVEAFYRPMFPTLIKYILLLFAKMLVVILCSFIQVVCTNKIVNHLANIGRTTAFYNCEYLPISYFDSEPAGKTSNRIIYDVNGFITLYRQLINLFASAILSFIFAYVGMFVLDFKLALLSFVIYPFIYIWVKFFLKKLKKIAENVNESRSLLSAKVNEIINGIQILQVFNFKKNTLDEFNKINSDYVNEQLKEVKLSVTSGWNLINVFKAAITTLVVVYFSLQSKVIGGITVTAGLIYAYNEYLLNIVKPINIIFSQIGQFEHAHVQIERISKLIEGKTESTEKHELPRYKGDITFDNVWFSYVDKEYVLKGVSLDVKAGQMLGLVGHTGSGKSSMMNLLLRFYDITDPISGHIYVDGTDIDTYSARTYRNNIGIVLQEPAMLEGTIADNIRFGMNDVTDEQIEQTLKSMGGDKLIKKYPEGIHQKLSRKGLNLSSGEKQIISLARAIVHNPSILIMDEATSHIDVETESIIKESLAYACKGRTVIVIAHRLSTIFNADKIVVLDHGLKVEEGTHQELLDKNGVYASIYRSQVAAHQGINE